MNKHQALAVLNVVKNATYTELSREDKVTIIRWLGALKRVKEQIDEERKEAVERLKPSNMDEIQGAVSRIMDLPTLEERKELIESDEEVRNLWVAYVQFEQEVGDVMADILNDSLDIITPSWKTMEEFVVSNDFSVEDALFLTELAEEGY